MRRTLTAAALTLVLGTATAARADVQVGITIGVPPPTYAFDVPPRVVVVPGVPDVHYAPDVSVNFFTYGGRYYTYNDGAWFVAHSGRGPWSYVERHYVPAPVLRVPSRYYHVPPRLVGGGHWDHDHGKARYHHKKWKHDGKHRGGRGKGKHRHD